MDISFSFIAQSDDEVETASGTERAALNRTLALCKHLYRQHASIKLAKNPEGCSS